MAAKIIALLQDKTFEAEHVLEMAMAFDMATARLTGGDLDLVRELVESKIIDVATTTGERDAEKLCSEALTRLGVFE